MHRGIILLQFAAWATGIQALLDDASNGVGVSVRAPEGPEVDARGAPELHGFVTFKMAQAKTSVSEKSPGDDSPTRLTYRKERDEPLLSKVSRIAGGLAKKYGSELPSRTTPQEATLVDRGNTYTVSTPTAPTQSNSAGVYQDGTDYSYFIQAQLGSSATPMYMLIDTGASTTWVMGSGCTSDACTTHNTFGSEDSKTLQDTGSSFAVEYGSGDVSGHIVKDSFTVAGLSTTYSFGLANVTSSQFTQFPFDGILGLARSSGNFPDALKEAKLIASNLFAVSISRAADGTNNGEISFGATDPAKFTGDVSYTTVTGGGSWVIPMDDVTVGGKAAGVTGRTAYIDTGTTYAFAPSADVTTMYKMIPGASSGDNGVTWTMPCDTTATVAITFSGKSYTISAKDFLSAPGANNRCTGNIFGMEVVAGSWLLGDVFLKNVYSVFDIDGGRIGFASKPTLSSSSTSTTTSVISVSTMTTSGGSTTLTTMTSAQTIMPSMGFTGGFGSSASSASSVSSATATAAGTPTATSQTASSSGHRFDHGSLLVFITGITSIIAMFM